MDDEEFQRIERWVRGQQTKPWMPKAASRCVRQIIGRRGLAAEQHANELEQVWRQLEGDFPLRGARPGPLRRGVLEVQVPHSVLVQELTFLRHELLERLRTIAPHFAIRDLRFRVIS